MQIYILATTNAYFSVLNFQDYDEKALQTWTGPGFFATTESPVGRQWDKWGHEWAWVRHWQNPGQIS